MQREPVLRTARNGVAEPRSEQEQRVTVGVGPMTSLRDLRADRASRSSAWCCSSPPSSPRATPRPPGAPAPRRGGAHRERAGGHGQDRHSRATGRPARWPGSSPGQLSGILTIPALHLTRPGGGGHRRPGAQRGRRARPAVGVARCRRRRRLPGPRRELLRAPQRAQAGRRDHLPDRLQHGEVRASAASRWCRPARRWPTRPGRAWCSTPAGRPTRSSSRPDRLLVRATEVGAATKGANLDPGAQFIRTVTSTDYTTSAPPALQAQGLTLEQNEAPMGTMNLVNASVAFAQSPGAALARGRRARDLLRRPARRRPAAGGLVGRHGARPGHAAPARRGGGHRARRPARRGDRLGGREPDPGGPAHLGDPAGGLRSGPARHDGRSPCSRRCRDHRELDLRLSRALCAERGPRTVRAARRARFPRGNPG